MTSPSVVRTGAGPEGTGVRQGPRLRKRSAPGCHTRLVGACRGGGPWFPTPPSGPWDVLCARRASQCNREPPAGSTVAWEVSVCAGAGLGAAGTNAPCRSRREAACGEPGPDSGRSLSAEGQAHPPAVQASPSSPSLGRGSDPGSAGPPAGFPPPVGINLGPAPPPQAPPQRAHRPSPGPAPQLHGPRPRACACAVAAGAVGSPARTAGTAGSAGRRYPLSPAAPTRPSPAAGVGPPGQGWRRRPSPGPVPGSAVARRARAARPPAPS